MNQLKLLSILVRGKVYKSHRTVCIVPARGGSKGIPRKNILEVCGKPLIAHSIEQAKRSKYVDYVLVSTEDVEIADISRRFGAEVPFLRPLDLADDCTPAIDVLLHAVDYLEDKGHRFDIV